MEDEGRLAPEGLAAERHEEERAVELPALDPELLAGQQEGVARAGAVGMEQERKAPQGERLALAGPELPQALPALEQLPEVEPVAPVLAEVVGALQRVDTVEQEPQIRDAHSSLSGNLVIHWPADGRSRICRWGCVRLPGPDRLRAGAWGRPRAAGLGPRWSLARARAPSPLGRPRCLFFVQGAVSQVAAQNRPSRMPYPMIPPPPRPTLRPLCSDFLRHQGENPFRLQPLNQFRPPSYAQ